MTLGLLTGKHDGISVYDIGLTNQTAADGLAVGRASAFAGHAVANAVTGCFTVEDAALQNSDNKRAGAFENRRLRSRRICRFRYGNELARVVFGGYLKVTTENALLTNAGKQCKAVGRIFEIGSVFL